MTPLGFDPHNHAHCIRDAVAAAQDHCAAEGLHLTPVRRRVLELLLDRHRAMGAYDILDVLRAEGLGSQPPVAYRALEFLTKHGFAHRIERLNAFVACTHPAAPHDPAFLICRKCEAVAETAADARLGRAAADTGFHVEETVVEMQGLCPKCQDTDAP
ncbi:transcriptional repressor [Jannaschia sp. M317]|uniref:transcriptional repressor n=1 Tax=Jannaschia sp. M317 TaxID=2867011 RepID=UPI0021A7DC02|nr:transcriptional repressor [Jannaschia sp. M317]UWQ17753.1 transcriptional repressor [Jannaschia sp. M317]